MFYRDGKLWCDYLLKSMVLIVDGKRECLKKLERMLLPAENRLTGIKSDTKIRDPSKGLVHLTSYLRSERLEKRK